MPVDFEIKFKNTPPLQCELNDTDLARRYLDLLQNHYRQYPNPIFRDPQRYTMSYFMSLIKEAKQVLGWDWHRQNYDLATTTLLHKDIETYLANGYENIPEAHDHILDELHFALHAIESGSQRNSWLQIEWFDDAGFAIDSDEYPAKLNLEFGDLRLQNPYVGHHPLYLYEQQDASHVSQTCRFHDFVKPGINIVINKTNTRLLDWNKYFQWFGTHAQDFLTLHGEQKLKAFTGHPVVGRVLNLAALEELITKPEIEFEHITFA